MRTSLFFIFSLLLGAFCTAQELVGPDCTSPGTLASFEITPAQEVSWHIVTPMPSVASYQVDTGLSKLYFASPERGHYTVIAGIVIEGTPKLLTKTFDNGVEEVVPLPTPPVSSLESWIKTQMPILVKSNDLASESRLIANCFEEIVRRIDEGNIKTVQNARAQLQIALTGTLALASPTAVTDWTPFLTELSRQLEKELGQKIHDLTAVKTALQNVSEAMTVSKNVSALPNVTNPNVRNQGTQNRFFRNLLAK